MTTLDPMAIQDRTYTQQPLVLSIEDADDLYSSTMFLTAGPMGGQNLRGRVPGISMTVSSIVRLHRLPDLPLVLEAYLDEQWYEALRRRPIDARNSSSPAIIAGYSIELYNQLEVPVTDFEDAAKACIHPVRCTGDRLWRNGKPRRDHVF